MTEPDRTQPEKDSPQQNDTGSSEPVDIGTSPPADAEPVDTAEEVSLVTDPRQFRVSEQERQHVAGVLHEALERGLLDPAEFTARTETALESTTRAELNGVLANLPGLIHRDRLPSS